ncbi:MAG: ComF family protein [Prevotella sp.]|nr:ComF family protein [Prevotella sp.]
MSIWRALIDLIAPRPCVMCGERLDVEEEFVCRTCLSELPRTHYDRTPYENRMAQMFWGLMPVERAAAWFYYAPATKTSQIIYDLKYHHQPDIGMVMGQQLAHEYMASGFFEGIDAIIPIPITKERQLQRGYNQSAMIARGISSETGIPVEETAVRRLHFEKSQTKLGRWERLKNVEQQFQTDDAARWHGKHILLVDDVTTTGATIIACANALHPKQHNIRFSVLTLGYTYS